MKLLVSVRDGVEARAAVDGGADIVDAKDPTLGALGAVTSQVLKEIRAAVPLSVPLSAALGEASTLAEVDHAFDRVSVALRYVKLAFPRVQDGNLLSALMRHAVERTGGLSGNTGLIAVAYADWQLVQSLPPNTMADLAVEAGAQGVLFDTIRKGGETLFDLIESSDLRAYGRTLARQEASFAVGGSLGEYQIEGALNLKVDVYGVRGAVCVGGRTSSVDQAKVRHLVESIELRMGTIKE